MDLRRLIGNATVGLALATAAQTVLAAPGPPTPSPEEARIRRAFPKGLSTWRDGRPHRILLPGETVAADKSLPALREASLRIVSENRDVFGVAAEDLVLETERAARNVVYQIFGRIHEGLPVEGSRVDFRWTRLGGLTMVGMDLATIGDVDVDPSLDDAGAFAAAAAAVGLGHRAVMEGMELVVVPDGHLKQRGDRLAYKCFLRAPPFETGWWVVWIDAHRGDVLEARDLILHGAPQGEVRISYEPLTAGDTEVVRPAPHATIALHRQDGEPVGGPVFTDEQGRFSFPESGSDLVYLTYLEGRYCKVINESAGNLTPVIEVPVGKDPGDTILWDEGNSWVVERDAYAHVNIAHDVTKGWDPGFTFWDQPMPTVVESNGTCNAYFDGRRIVFYRLGGGCEATGRIADVIYHEYAHAITWALYLPQSAPADMHEAYSDYYGTTITDQPFVGLGFFGPGTSLRSVDNERRWPLDRHSDPHITGLILAGALWDLRESVGPEVADPLYHFHRYGRPMSFNEAFLEILLVDDDDGNVFNGTPHFDEITAAFLSHGIGNPSVQIQHEPLPDTELTQTELAVSANVLSLFGLEPDSLLLYYRGEPESPFNELRMEADPGGGTRAFRTTIPGQREGTRIEYYLFAADTSGHRASLPAEAPGDVFTFLVGRDDVPPVVSSERIAHGTADQSAFEVEARVTDNTGLIDGVEMLTRRPPDGEVTALPLSPVSADLYAGVLEAGEVLVGDVIEYRITATDASAGANQASWPPDGSWAAFEIREGWFESLEQTDGGLEPHGDWAWGDLADSKGEAHSGDKVWATKLEGPYTGLAHSPLDLELDLTGWDRGTLEFWHRYAAEDGQDGGRILVSRDGGQNFRPIAPRRGYPWRQVAALGDEGYSGRIDFWEMVEVPLDIYLDQRISIRFEFASDREFGDDGWILDDIRFIRRQTLAEPIALTAASGQPTRIPLSWKRPRSVIPDANHERFAGYNVYRGTVSGNYDVVPINPSPMRNESYVDEAVEPGVTYYYTVTAVYDEGESPFAREVSGSATDALLSVSVDSMNVHLEKDASVDTTFVITNAGSGDLLYETYIGDPGQRVSDVRLVYEPGGGSVAKPRTLHFDAEEGASPDIASLSAGDDGERLVLLLREHSPHGDPRHDFTVTFGLDTDLDQETGDRTVNHGSDYIVIVGAQAWEIGNEPAVIVDGVDRVPVGLPVELSVMEGEDSVRVGIPLSLIETPERMAIRGVTLDREGVTVDSQPDDPGASWLSRTPTGGSVSPSSPAVVTLSLTADGLTDGEYRGRVLLETSDIGRPEALIAVVLTVGAGPGILASVEFNDLEEGIEIRWSVSPDAGVRAFRLYRSLEGDEEVRIGNDIHPEEDGAYRYLDRLAVMGGTHTYRFEGVNADGSTRPFGLETTVYDPPAPLELFMQRPRPSPFRSTVLVRFGIPRPGPVDLDIYDVRGRRVATLLHGHAQAGVHDLIWDGRDGSGRRAASGVYFALLRWERIKSVRRLVLAR